jgi:transposase
MIGQFHPNQLVFLDESGTNTSFTRLFSRALKGERALGKTPRKRGKNQTLIAAMSLKGIRTTMMVEGGTSGDVFVVFIKKFLIQKLNQGQVVIMDNLPAHYRKEVRILIEGVGCQVIFLPSYSPDFNPIEMFFSWLKGQLRKLEMRTVECLIEAVGVLEREVTMSMAEGWFGACGYYV